VRADHIQLAVAPAKSRIAFSRIAFRSACVDEAGEEQEHCPEAEYAGSQGGRRPNGFGDGVPPLFYHRRAVPGVGETLVKRTRIVVDQIRERRLYFDPAPLLKAVALRPRAALPLLLSLFRRG
jgi:hypothetical protein